MVSEKKRSVKPSQFLSTGKTLVYRQSRHAGNEPKKIHNNEENSGKDEDNKDKKERQTVPIEEGPKCKESSGQYRKE